MTDHGVNVPLLRKTLEYITAHPEEWDQSTWAMKAPSCGTRYCLAGTTVMLSGEYHVDWNVVEVDHPDEYDEEFVTTNDCVESATGRVYDIEETAIELLNLDNVDGVWLFAGSHNLHALWNVANALTNGEIEIPEDLPGETMSRI